MNSFTRIEDETRTEFDGVVGINETFRKAERARNAGKPGFDSFGTPAPTTFGALGGMTLPPAVTLSERDEQARLDAFIDRKEAEELDTVADEDDEQLLALRDRFNV